MKHSDPSSASPVPKRNLPLKPAAETAPDWAQIVVEQVKSLRFGVVQIVVHDAKVVQIERTERTRVEAGRGTGGE
jgi:hypothetical protein